MHIGTFRRSSAARRRLIDYLEETGLPGVVLTGTAAVSWATGGIARPVDRSAPTDLCWVVTTPDAAAIVTSEVEAARIVEEYDPQLHGFALLVVPWFEPDAFALAAQSFAGVPSDELASDGIGRFGRDITDDLVALRLVLCEGEQEEIRSLGRLAASALGSCLRAWRPGVSTDFEVQAHLVSLLEAQGADSPVVIVGGDERVRRFRHPVAVGAPIHEVVMAVVVARRAGLHVAATRHAFAHSPTEDQRALVAQVDAVDDAVLSACGPGATYGDALDALAEAYASQGAGGAWRQHYQGGPIGFQQREFEIAPGQRESRWYGHPVEAGNALAWNPSLSGGAKLEDTYLVGANGLERVTWDPTWPTIDGPAAVKDRPAALVLGQ
ncbi:MAG: hypothetical protein JWM85_487 [Acidimicrobiaceae bacterium]|nr:hypothetical protein [Acidimicrobiaceae bacterium]